MAFIDEKVVSRKAVFKFFVRDEMISRRLKETQKEFTR